MEATLNSLPDQSAEAQVIKNWSEDEFQWVEVAHGSENSNWNRYFTHQNDVAEFLEQHPTDSFSSVYLFNSGDGKVVLQARQAKEQAIIGDLFIDFDPPKDVSLEDGLGVVLKDARSFMDSLEILMNGPPDGVSTFFSGRGIHIELDHRLFNTVPDSKLNLAYKLFVEEIVSRVPQNLETLDSKVFDNGRLKRIEGSINSKSGLYKTWLSLDEFKTLTPAAIIELAKDWRGWSLKPLALEPNPGAAEIFQACLEAVHEGRISPNQDVVAPWVELQLEKSNFRDLIDNPVPGIPTFSAELNRMLNGGLKPGRVINLVAQAGGGKTTFAWQLGHELAANKIHVLYVSMEMSIKELLTKSVSRLVQVDAGLIESGEWQNQTQTVSSNGNLHHLEQRLEAAWRQCAELQPYLYVWETSSDRKVDSLEQRLLEFRTQFNDKPLVVIIDPFQRFVNGNDKNGDETSRTAQLAQGLKDMSKKYNVALVSLSDTNKENHKDQKWDHTALRGSYVIAQVADVIIGIRTDANLKNLLEDDANKWPVALPQQSLDKATGDPIYACLEICKNKTGRLGKIPFVYKRAYCKFAPLPQPGIDQIDSSKGKNSRKKKKSQAGKAVEKNQQTLTLSTGIIGKP